MAESVIEQKLGGCSAAPAYPPVPALLSPSPRRDPRNHELLQFLASGCGRTRYREERRVMAVVSQPGTPHDRGQNLAPFTVWFAACRTGNRTTCSSAMFPGESSCWFASVAVGEAARTGCGGCSAVPVEVLLVPQVGLFACRSRRPLNRTARRGQTLRFIRANRRGRPARGASSCWSVVGFGAGDGANQHVIISSPRRRLCPVRRATRGIGWRFRLVRPPGLESRCRTGALHIRFAIFFRRYFSRRARSASSTRASGQSPVSAGNHRKKVAVTFLSSGDHDLCAYRIAERRPDETKGRRAG